MPYLYKTDLRLDLRNLLKTGWRPGFNKQALSKKEVMTFGPKQIDDGKSFNWKRSVTTQW